MIMMVWVAGNEILLGGGRGERAETEEISGNFMSYHVSGCELSTSPSGLYLFTAF